MKIERTSALVPWYTVAECARDWGWTPENVVAACDAGHFALIERNPFGTPVLTITAADRAQFEARHASSIQPRDLRADAKRSYLEALAVTLTYAFGKDPELLKADARASELEQFAAQLGIPLARCHKTYANVFREARAVLVEWKYIEPESPQAANEAEAKRAVNG
jgi:hypothetical protein